MRPSRGEKRGVNVRVLLDRELRPDGTEDTINHRAARYMQLQGCRCGAMNQIGAVIPS